MNDVINERRAPMYGLLLFPLLPVFIAVKAIVWIVKHS